MSIKTYNEKRDFTKTKEPAESKKKTAAAKTLRFVVQRHHASRLHYDFRLEMEGVLKSWAVPKGPSLNPKDKRLAMMVEDHPYDYKDFEGEIPKGNYGAGNVYKYDEGTYEPLEIKGNSEKELLKELNGGSIKFRLKGKKLKGEFALVKMKTAEDNSWLLIKHNDEHALKKFDIEADIPQKIKDKKNKTSAEKGNKKEAVKKVAGKQETKKQIASAKEESSKKTSDKNEALREYKPMLATLADKAFDDEDWIFENKWDGYRAIAEVHHGKVKLYSRNGNSFITKFGSVVDELKKIEHDVVLDGEVMAIGKKDKADFQMLQNWDSEKSKGRQLVYCVFDILYLNGHEIIDLPLFQRKELLNEFFNHFESKIVINTECVKEKGIKLFKDISKKGGEGIIAKKADGAYVLNKRSREWLKIKTHMRQEVIIAGYTAPKGGRTAFGSILLAIYKDGKLTYSGKCGTGFDDDMLKELLGKMKPLTRKTSPFDKAPKLRDKITWLKPELICEVKFTEWTGTGSLRHPVFLGLRSDKGPKEIKKEVAVDVNTDKPEEEISKKTFAKKSAAKSSLKDEKESSRKVKSTKKRENKLNRKIDGNTVTLTNQNKLYWKEENISKGDLIDYYESISEYILPYLKDRPQSLLRHPNGYNGKAFFQKDMNVDQIPGWLKTEEVYSESTDKNIDYLVCNNLSTLLFMVNLGCIEINPWLSRLKTMDKPDYLVLDLDPVDVPFSAVVETALAAKEVIDEQKLKAFVKTSGSKGIHIFIPCATRYTYEQTRHLTHLLAKEVYRKLPDITSLERSPSKRKKKVYLDYLQNGEGKTLASVYSARPKPGATVSTPLEWSEVKESLKLSDFDIFNALDRIKEKGDLWKDMLSTNNSLGPVIKRLEKKQK